MSLSSSTSNVSTAGREEHHSRGHSLKVLAERSTTRGSGCNHYGLKVVVAIGTLLQYTIFIIG